MPKSATEVNLVGERELVVTRTFDAPRDLVFRAFTEPEHIKQWWAPRPYTVPTCEVDLRPGGVWLYSMRSPEGEEHWGRAVYEEISPPERLVFRDAFADAEGNPTSDETLNDYTFEDRDGKTLVTITTRFANAAHRDETLKMGMEEGLSMALDQLAELLATLARR